MHRILELFEFQASLREMVNYAENAVVNASYVDVLVFYEDTMNNGSDSSIHLSDHSPLKHFYGSQLFWCDQGIG